MPRLIEEWARAKRALDAAKAEEYKLRLQVIEKNFPKTDELLPEGTEKKALKGGFELKAEFRVERKIVVSPDKVNKALERVPEENRSRLIVWDPRLVVSEYRRLTGGGKKAIDAIITAKQGSTQLSLVPPAGVKTPEFVV